ncbi:HAAS signaling domain-containing protein [Pediococcus parvulus]
MNKSTYIKNLQTYLSGLTKDEQNDVIDFYSEYIEDANLQSDWI